MVVHLKPLSNDIRAPKKTFPMIFSLSTYSFSTQMEAASWNFCSQRELDRDLSTAKELQSLCCRVVRARERESCPALESSPSFSSTIQPHVDRVMTLLSA